MARYQVGLQTEERILAATRSLLAEVGLEGTTLKAICDQAGVRAGSFYNLFRSKEEAVLRVVSEALAAVDPHPDGAGTETVEELVDAFVRFFTEEPGLARIYLQIAVNGGLNDDVLRERVLRSHNYRVDRFADALRRRDPGLSPTEAHQRTEALLATLHGLGLIWLLDPSIDLEGHAHRLLGEFASA